MMRKYFIIISALLGLCACSPNTVKVEGRFAGVADKNVTLEQITPSATTVADSTKTDSKGGFKFKVTLPNSQATLYNLKYEDENLTLLLSPGDKVKLSALAGIRDSYKVSGSEESILVKEIKDILTVGATRLDSIMKIYNDPNITPEKHKEAAQSYLDEYYAIKREHIKFIIENSKTLASVYALSQRLPNDNVLFNGDSDVVYYRIVADSVETTHPTSPYLAQLRSQINNIDANVKILNQIEQSLQNPISFPEIEMKDMYGNTHKLSETEDKVILLSFWSTGYERSAMLNAEMKEIYNELKGRGFEIFQVSIDTSRPKWVAAVQDQKLPWISVNDFKGVNSPAVTSYAVNSVPSNFLIDRNGDIVNSNIGIDDLRAEVLKHL